MPDRRQRLASGYGTEASMSLLRELGLSLRSGGNSLQTPDDWISRIQGTALTSRPHSPGVEPEGRRATAGRLNVCDGCEVKGRADGADSVTLTINEVNTGRNAPHRFRLALVSIEGDRASPPVYVSGVDWGLPGFGDTQITKNLQHMLAAGRAPH